MLRALGANLRRLMIPEVTCGTVTIKLVVQGSVRSGASSGGSPITVAYPAFNKAQGSITRSGAALPQVTGARPAYDNSIETVCTIRADRRNEGAAGVKAAFDFHAAFRATATRMMTVVRRNQQAATEHA